MLQPHTLVAASCLSLALVLNAATADAQRGRGNAAPVDSSVPSNLRALLAPRHSEIRLVAQRYAADRTLLAGNYAAPQPPQNGGRGAGGGRGAADSSAGGGGRGRDTADSTAGGGRGRGGAGGR